MELKDIKFSQDCWVFYGSCDWSIDSAYHFIESAGRIFEMFGTKATHYGFSETPYDTIKGAHIGSARNVIKKTDTVYQKDAELTSLEFFLLPKEWNSSYQDNSIYLARYREYIAISYDMDLFPNVDLSSVFVEMKKNIIPIWGEHFQIQKREMAVAYINSTQGYPIDPARINKDQMVHDQYVYIFDKPHRPAHIIEQFECE